MAGATAGLIPDALQGVQGAAFVCLLALGVLSQEEGQGAQAPFLLPPALPPDPLLTQYISWYLLRPTRDLWRCQLGWLAMPIPIPIPRPGMQKLLPFP